MLHRLKGRLGWKLATVGLVLGLGVSQTSTAAEELRIGFIAPLTGGFAQVGKDMSNGFQMYLDEVGGSFAGAKVKFIVEDTEAKPPVAVRKAEKLAAQPSIRGVGLRAGIQAHRDDRRRLCLRL